MLFLLYLASFFFFFSLSSFSSSSMSQKVMRWWSSILWFVYFSAFSTNSTGSKLHEQARRRLDDVGGNINIDCGIPEGSTTIDPNTDIHYTTDSHFINTGINSNISPKFISEDLQKVFMNVRSFPQGNRSCYTLRPPEGKATIYLIRASFMYGDYDGLNKLPEFDLYVGMNLWDTVKFDSASHVVIKEIILAPMMDNIYVCLIRTTSDTPFISVLEVRHFHTSIYRTESGPLLLHRRLDVGSTSNRIIRFKDDVYDRMWFSFNVVEEELFNTSFTTDSLVESEYRLPSKVMQTAIRPIDVNDSLDLVFDIGDPTLKYYVYMHFAELQELEDDQLREFNIELNGKLWQESVVPNYLRSITIHNNQSVRGASLKFRLYKTPRSVLPPIVNAMEIYILKDFLQAFTAQEDVLAILDIKMIYEVVDNWEGDPCGPIFTWDDVNCSYSGYDPPRIISLNLSSKGLKGQISPSLSKIKSLQYLDLSNNSLRGEVPESLSQLSDLMTLNLAGNKLSGLIPSGLTEKSRKGSLSLSIEGNLDICLSPPCRNGKKNIVVPVVAVIISLVVLLVAAFLFLWIFKRKKAQHFLLKFKQGSLKSDNRQFTYTEIVSITNNFETVVGKGGFGTVYHGKLDDGMQVAVKMLSSFSAQGSEQFRTEAQLLMRVHHKNLTTLVGYCHDSTNFGIVYEYMSYGNLEQYLSAEANQVLSWRERLKIAVDTAQGLEYLHHGCKPPIIHRDVKSANILLNEKMQAKIADFGFSKFFPVESGSHLLTSIVGTVGYLDPEYYSSGRLTEKSDVYSFGVVLLELITGQPAVIQTHENTNIIKWVSLFMEKGDIRRIIDPRLEENYEMNSVWKALEIAMSCVPSTSIQRPPMNHVVIELKECLETEMSRDITSSTSFDITPFNLGAEIGPQAR
ncbi:putative leucine-rich repeat receptor-like protein kinase At2g19210 isoform X1 [Carica papaya]|uniref:putative leucine-rich repeat receptor-like protein kinase At2g19210 isoform X1 n=1 Tax=Carica papaya TaxID=3649 RepID=UPI000B8C753A|nr:putative leucine-rich repeat receptor-like protein kinase At2g19210 isoform X1 [Carica papaya]